MSAVGPSSSPGIPARVGPRVVPADVVPDRRGVSSFFSHSTRSGHWILPRAFRALATLGRVDLDLTEAQLGPGVSEIEVVTIVGHVRIQVPPDIRVECDGDAFLGLFEMVPSDFAPAPLDAPHVRIIGCAYLGHIEVRVVDPNAPKSWIAKLRQLRQGRD